MFKDRVEAGQKLAGMIVDRTRLNNGIVLGLVRGGVVLAKAVSDRLVLPLDILVVKKIGCPGHEELAIGAVGPFSAFYFDDKICGSLGISESTKRELLEKKISERNEKEDLLRGDKKALDLKGRDVLIVDDGVATGATVLAALRSVREMGAEKVFLAVPVIAFDTLEQVKREYNDVYYLEAPEEFSAVGQFYNDFPQVTDSEVKKLL